jgi:hypothetical protein
VRKVKNILKYMFFEKVKIKKKKFQTGPSINWMALLIIIIVLSISNSTHFCSYIFPIIYIYIYSFRGGHPRSPPSSRWNYDGFFLYSTDYVGLFVIIARFLIFLFLFPSLYLSLSPWIWVIFWILICTHI